MGSEGMNMKEWEYQLVNNHIENFNMRRLERFSPSYRLCVNEIFQRWYGLGGDWINLGLPHYVHMDLKQDSGFKIQDN